MVRGHRGLPVSPGASRDSSDNRTQEAHADTLRKCSKTWFCFCIFNLRNSFKKQAFHELIFLHWYTMLLLISLNLMRVQTDDNAGRKGIWGRGIYRW